MNRECVRNKRKVGGFGFASSMIRSNIDTVGYIKHIINVINLKLFENEEVLTYRIGTTGFELLVQDDSVLIGELDYIEKCRSISVTEFERIIINSLVVGGYEVDTDNEYYYAVVK